MEISAHSYRGARRDAYRPGSYAAIPQSLVGTPNKAAAARDRDIYLLLLVAGWERTWD